MSWKSVVRKTFLLAVKKFVCVYVKRVSIFLIRNLKSNMFFFIVIFREICITKVLTIKHKLSPESFETVIFRSILYEIRKTRFSVLNPIIYRWISFSFLGVESKNFKFYITIINSWKNELRLDGYSYFNKNFLSFVKRINTSFNRVWEWF